MIQSCSCLEGISDRGLSLTQIDTYLNKEKAESLSKEAQKKLENAIGENRQLKSDLLQTQTHIDLLKDELNQMRNQYDAKCYELNEYDPGIT